MVEKLPESTLCVILNEESFTIFFNLLIIEFSHGMFECTEKTMVYESSSSFTMLVESKLFLYFKKVSMYFWKDYFLEKACFYFKYKLNFRTWFK